MQGEPKGETSEFPDDLYEALRALAQRALCRKPSVLDPTDLVHQAWLQLAEKYQDTPRAELLALCATIVRRLAIDEARRRANENRTPERITLTGIASRTVGHEVDVTELEIALEKLRKTDARWARIVELRYFGGLTTEEVAQAIGLSCRTVAREWTLARSWLKRELT